MRVIFLDFDGVLNVTTAEPDLSGELWTERWLVPALVARLSRLVEAADATVVVSSSWRQRRSRDELAAILAHHGHSRGVYDVTPRLPRPPEGERLVRAREIAAWLASHPAVTAFVILDDDADFGDLSPSHVHVDATVGLTDGDVERALTLLDADLASRTRS